VFKTRSFTLREEYRLSLFENRVLRRIFESGRTMEKLHNEELKESCPRALTEHHAMNEYGGSRGIAPLIL
jgi:tRNA U34 5-carboxymethylaminomethyl modifying enzyme MnmG/GidA